MKIGILSDLHLEGRSYIPVLKEQDMDVLVLAGDITVGQGAAAWARKHYKNIPIIYVAGNHEYYNFFDKEKVREAISRSCEEFDVKFLEDASEIYSINDVDFTGGTLFTNFKGGASYGIDPTLAKLSAKQFIRDFSVSDMKIEFYESKFETFMSNLKANFSNRKSNNKLCVVSHYAPCTASIHRSYRNPTDAVLNPYFVNDLNNFITYECYDSFGFNINLWIHGHVHNAFDYEVNKTRVVCNPRGYKFETMNNFNENKIVEI